MSGYTRRYTRDNVIGLGRAAMTKSLHRNWKADVIKFLIALAFMLSTFAATTGIAPSYVFASYIAEADGVDAEAAALGDIFRAIAETAAR